MPILPQRDKKETNSRVLYTTDKSFYRSYRWKTQSLLFLSNNRLCVECKKEGKIVVATVTDHIIPIRSGIDPYDRDNWQALCIKCHNTKSAKERAKQFRHE